MDISSGLVQGDYLAGAFTSESVSKGHPDKFCDLIADRVMDAILAIDKYARTAIEVTAVSEVINIFGEFGSTTVTLGEVYDIAREVAAQTIHEVYPNYGGYSYNPDIRIGIVRQSSEIAKAVIENGEDGLGAGDQGIMFGYAENTTSGIGREHALAHGILLMLEEDVQNGLLGSDGKSQVTSYVDPDGNIQIGSILVSHQAMDFNVSHLEYRVKNLMTDLIPVLGDLSNKPNYLKTRRYVNPSGSFEFGGPAADSGLTGRKIIVDTYGGKAPHGGGAFSGKDSTKVDRSAAYAARQAALTVVSAGIAERCQVQLSYGIGLQKPLSVKFETFGTGSGDTTDNMIAEVFQDTYDFSPGGIVKNLKLWGSNLDTVFSDHTNYGHMGRVKNILNGSPLPTWEQPHAVTKEALQQVFSFSESALISQ